jgi:hypothetical protein
VDGFVGNFKTTIAQGQENRTLEHGVTIMATGATEHHPEDPALIESSRVMTGLQLQQTFNKEDSPGSTDLTPPFFCNVTAPGFRSGPFVPNCAAPSPSRAPWN